MRGGAWVERGWGRMRLGRWLGKIRLWAEARLAGQAGGQRGATTAEYALLLALVVITLIGTLSALGGALNSKLQGIINNLNGG